jgi:hypothetical protein
VGAGGRYQPSLGGLELSWDREIHQSGLTTKDPAEKWNEKLHSGAHKNRQRYQMKKKNKGKVGRESRTMEVSIT